MKGLCYVDNHRLEIITTCIMVKREWYTAEQHIRHEKVVGWHKFWCKIDQSSVAFDIKVVNVDCSVFVGLIIIWNLFAVARCWMLDWCCNFSCHTFEGIWLCQVYYSFIMKHIWGFFCLNYICINQASFIVVSICENLNMWIHSMLQAHP